MFSINLVSGFIGVLNLGGRGRSFWNMSSGGSSPALACEGPIGADGALSGGSLHQHLCINRLSGSCDFARPVDVSHRVSG